MSKIVEFPSRDIRNNLEIEKALRESLIDRGFSEETVTQTVSAIMPLIKESKEVVAQSIDAPIPGGMSEKDVSELKISLSSSLQVYQRQVGDFTLKILILLAIEYASNSKA
ncbi:hypothetical protein HGG82_11960 [Marinomonas sp. M1K-6]|uniref:Uncharacterized protein n=1 Tax=Marinomonas profundi TaxID=2726122 RepID=A0A847QYU2_9GAMM|nr:hypothetical protein [Marinomonas profundi]NLQ18329.1 hypothetical protein [Marinomonas profundi]UDV02392.1 hypothetical protein J8N69_12415 [Marinomonas profundi]